MAKAPAKKLLTRGVEPLSRSAHYHKAGLWAKKRKEWKKTPKKIQKTEKKVKKFGKDGKETRTIEHKHARFYAAENIPKRIPRRFTPKPARLRKTITPGTVLILLAGRFRGKRVVFLSQLPSGLLLVTGPYKINGVPLRRVNQRYVIATSTKLDISNFKLDAKFTDAYFKKAIAADKKAKAEKKQKKGGFAAAAKPAKDDKTKKAQRPKKPVNAEKVTDQKAVDTGILEAVKKIPELELYLHARFSLSRNDIPHLLKF
jgi:large subunit ribosomal protein L6e